jgi:hypothetical protein
MAMGTAVITHPTAATLQLMALGSRSAMDIRMGVMDTISRMGMGTGIFHGTDTIVRITTLIARIMDMADTIRATTTGHIMGTALTGGVIDLYRSRTFQGTEDTETRHRVTGPSNVGSRN